MKKIIKIKVLALLLAIMGGSCKDALEENPYSFISPDQLGDSEDAAKIWVNGVIGTFNNGHFFGWGIFNRPHETDSDDATGPNWAFASTGAGNFSGNTDINAYWSDLYTLIERANLAIERISAMQNLSEPSRANALGQLKFLRAWGYYTLAKAFGPVPLYKTSAATTAHRHAPRSPLSDVYAFIIEDLKSAEADLYGRANPAYVTGKISSEAAKTLLAKVYLTMASGALQNAQVKVLGGPQGTSNARIAARELLITKSVVAGHEGFNAAQYFELARNKAKEVIDANKVHLFNDWSSIWTKANRGREEHLWMIYGISNDEQFGNLLHYQYAARTVQNGMTIPRFAPNGGGFFGLSDHWYELFQNDQNDSRIREGIVHKWYTSGGTGRWYPKKEEGNTDFGWEPGFVYSSDDQTIARVTKFSDVTDRTANRSDGAYPFLRFAETLLIFAEAENEVNGPTQDAVNALNRVRTRSKASAVVLNTELTKVDLRSRILEERRRELALEGNRSWDLKRWGIYLQVMNAIGTVDVNNIVKSREERHLLFPIPLDELNGNDMINENNFGW